MTRVPLRFSGQLGIGGRRPGGGGRKEAHHPSYLEIKTTPRTRPRRAVEETRPHLLSHGLISARESSPFKSVAANVALKSKPRPPTRARTHARRGERSAQRRAPRAAPYLRLPCPSFPSSASPQEYTSPSDDRARQCFPPEFTATFLMSTCWMDSSSVGVDTDSVPPTPRRPPAPYPVAYS